MFSTADVQVKKALGRIRRAAHAVDITLDKAVEGTLRVIDPGYDRLCGRLEAERRYGESLRQAAEAHAADPEVCERCGHKPGDYYFCQGCVCLCHAVAPSDILGSAS